MEKITQIEKEVLTEVLAARTKVAELTAAAENAVKDAKNAKTEFDLALAHLFLANGLARDCKVDIFTGAVTWPEVVEQIPEVISSVPETTTIVKTSKTAKVAKKSKKVK